MEVPTTENNSRITLKTSKTAPTKTILVSDRQECAEYLDMLASYFPDCLRIADVLAARDRDNTILIYELIEEL